MNRSSRDFETKLSLQDCADVFERAIRKRPLAMKVIPLETFTPTPSKYDVGETWDYSIGVSFQAVSVQMACKSQGSSTFISISRVGPMFGAAALPLWNHVLRAFQEADPNADVGIGQGSMPEPNPPATSHQSVQNVPPPPIPPPPSGPPPPPGPLVQPAATPVSQPAVAPPAAAASADRLIGYLENFDFKHVAPDWNDLRARLIEFHQMAPEVTIEDDTEHNFLAFTISSSNGRSQTSMIARIEGDKDPDWIKVESVVGPYHQGIALAAVEYVGQPENSGVGVARSGDYITLRWTATVGEVSMYNALRMIDGVAGMADRLESSLSQGRDIF